MLLATSLAVASADINDIIDVHSGNANDYADEVRTPGLFRAARSRPFDVLFINSFIAGREKLILCM